MSDPNTLLIASDHAGFALKDALVRLLHEFKWDDLGPSNDQRVDYPDFAEKLGRRVADEGAKGILICGSGIGMCMAANKLPGVRAATVNEPVSARLSREHNDANVICLGSRFIAPEYAAEIVRVWALTPFSGDSRHQGRIHKITALEKNLKGN